MRNLSLSNILHERPAPSTPCTLENRRRIPLTAENSRKNLSISSSSYSSRSCTSESPSSSSVSTATSSSVPTGSHGSVSSVPGVVGSDFAARAVKLSGTSRAEELAVTEEDDSACRAAGLGGGVGLGTAGGTRLVAYTAGPGEGVAFRSDGCVGGGKNCWDGLEPVFGGRGGLELMVEHTWG